MKREFKITLEDGDADEGLLPYMQAENREHFLFQLFNNFFREWKYEDDLVNIEDIKVKLWELKETYKIVLKDE